MNNTNTPTISTDTVKHVANLAHIPVSDAEAIQLAAAFEDTLAVIDHLREVDVTDVPPTNQVTGLENVWREDKVDEARMFSQTQALANASHTHQGFVVVDQVIDHDA